jgi:hypothetical protein
MYTMESTQPVDSQKEISRVSALGVVRRRPSDYRKAKRTGSGDTGSAT